MREMTELEFRRSVKQDPYNLFLKRNRRNTPRSAYNCGGFALNVYDWICPYIQTDDYAGPILDGMYTDDERMSYIIDLINEGWDREYIEEEILRYDVNFLLDEYPFLEPVNLEDCAPSDFVIAYRIFINIDEDLGVVEDEDFHFKIRINGFWFEKMGSDPVTLCQLDADEPWYVNDLTQYTSRIEYFIPRRSYYGKIK